MILAVTGLSREARAVAQPGLTTLVAGSGGHTLDERIRSALVSGARRILSVGICGALCPSLKVGDCIVATEVVTESERLPTCSQWTDELLATVPNAKPAVLAGSDVVAAHRAEKRRIRHKTNAAALDMESHIAARVANEHGLPFAVLRVVSDSSDQSLPPAALVAMSENGGVDLPAVVRSLVTAPRQIPALLRAGWEAEKAFRALLRCRNALVARPALAANVGEFALDVA